MGVELALSRDVCTSFDCSVPCVIVSHLASVHDVSVVFPPFQAELSLLSECFSDVDYDTLRAILKRETLNCKETVVFQAASNWAAAECARRDRDDTPDARRYGRAKTIKEGQGLASMTP